MPDQSTFAHVTWIGGSPCAGKSSIAAALASTYGMTGYTCDDEVARHTRETNASESPTLVRLGALDADGLWLRPVVQQIREEITFYEEEFPFILRDLAALPPARAVIAEGAALMPHLLHGIGVAADRALWIVPTPAFQRAHYERRAWRHDVLRGCSDPELGWARWMARDEGFATHVAADARRLGYRMVTVDGSRAIEEIQAEAEGHLRFGMGKN